MAITKGDCASPALEPMPRSAPGGCSSPAYSSVLLADNFKITGKVGALSAKPMGEAADGMAECKAGAQLL